MCGKGLQHLELKMATIYPLQQDLAWIATDMAGNVAVFITAGEGPIPRAALDYPDLALEEWEDRVLELPVSSKAKLLISVSKPEAYGEFAERGLFVYDWIDFHRPLSQQVGYYEPVAVPVKAITLSLLPQSLQTLASLISLNDRFDEGKGIDPANTVICVQAPKA